MGAIRSRSREERVAAAVALALVMACAPPPEGGSDPGAGGPAGVPATASITTDTGLRVTLSAAPVRPGAPLDLTLEVTNERTGEAVLDFPDGQRFDFEVLDDRETVWRWASDMFFPQVLGRERIPPGESIDWSARLEAGLPTGDYRIRGTLTTSPPVAVELPFAVPESTGDPSG